MININNKWTALALITCLCMSNLYAQNKKLIFESTFEDAGAIGRWPGNEKGYPESITLTDSIFRAGHTAARFMLRDTDKLVANGKRAELKINSEPKIKADRWYGFSNFLPADYTLDADPEIVAQWHEIPDFNLGETWRVPPIALSTKNGHWFLHIEWATQPINTNYTISGLKDIDLGPYDKNVWTDWVFHVRFSWQDDGILKIWKNGKVVFNLNGPNSYNDQNSPYFKIGLYKWVWNSISNNTSQKAGLQIQPKTKIIYYDEVRVGNENANYKIVKPRVK